MEEDEKLKRTTVKPTVHIPPSGTAQLWCGKVQGLCDGNICLTCHLFPRNGKLLSVERDSTIDSVTLTDHNKIGLTKEDEEE
jgi:hypothetical protein